MDDKTLELLGKRVDRAREINRQLSRLHELKGYLETIDTFLIRFYCRPNSRIIECNVSDYIKVTNKDMVEFLENMIIEQSEKLSNELDAL